MSAGLKSRLCWRFDSFEVTPREFRSLLSDRSLKSFRYSDDLEQIYNDSVTRTTGPVAVMAILDQELTIRRKTCNRQTIEQHIVPYGIATYPLLNDAFSSGQKFLFHENMRDAWTRMKGGDMSWTETGLKNAGSREESLQNNATKIARFYKEHIKRQDASLNNGDQAPNETPGSR